MAEEFPLPSSSYRELVRIIQGYGQIGSEASLTDVAHRTAIGETVISGNNKFLIAVGIIKPGKKKTITPIGAELAQALQHELTVEAGAKWRAIVEANDFLQKVIAAVRIRKGMDESSLESHVGYSAGQPKAPWVATGSRTVIEILKNAGLLKEEGGNLIATAAEPRPVPETVERPLSSGDSMQMGEKVELLLAPAKQSGGIQLSISVTVQCTPNDLDDLGHKLHKVLQDFHEAARLQEAPSSASSPPPAPPIASGGVGE